MHACVSDRPMYDVPLEGGHGAGHGRRLQYSSLSLLRPRIVSVHDERGLARRLRPLSPLSFRRCNHTHTHQAVGVWWAKQHHVMNGKIDCLQIKILYESLSVIIMIVYIVKANNLQSAMHHFSYGSI